MRVLISIEGNNYKLITREITPQEAGNVLAVVANLHTCEQEWQTQKYTTGNPQKIAVEILQDDDKRLPENDEKWMENYRLKQEIDRLKNPQPNPAVGVDKL